MTIRFLQTTQSGTPGFPFLAGQVITIEGPIPASFRAALESGLAELVRDADDAAEDLAVEAPLPETAIVSRKRGRRGGHRNSE
jgi:hypothetical protein